MLAKAPWTARMVRVHVRQAAIYAISKGWFVNTANSHGIQFSRAELALAAGTFLGDLRPNLPDDPDHTCAGLFSAGTAVCKSCGQTKIVPVPTFASAISWSSPTWVSLKQCIEQNCTPFPWISDPDDASWHEKACIRHDTDVIDIQIGPWAYVSFRVQTLSSTLLFRDKHRGIVVHPQPSNQHSSHPYQSPARPSHCISAIASQPPRHRAAGDSS